MFTNTIVWLTIQFQITNYRFSFLFFKKSFIHMHQILTRTKKPTRESKNLSLSITVFVSSWMVNLLNKKYFQFKSRSHTTRTDHEQQSLPTTSVLILLTMFKVRAKCVCIVFVLNILLYTYSYTTQQRFSCFK